MSMRLVHIAEDAPGTAFVVAAPQRYDALSGTLRAAYSDNTDARAFDDLLCILDTIDTVPR